MTSLFFRKHGLPMLLLVGISSFLFAPAVNTPFTYDDYPHFVNNARLQAPQGWRDVFKNGLQETRPVFNLSLALQAGGFGTSPRAAHAVNVLLHMAAGLLLYALILNWTLSVPVAAATALLFLVHPICVETVSYFNSRSGLLALFFTLAALGSLSSGKWWGYPAGIACLLLAMGSKEDGAAGAAIALLFHAWRPTTLKKNLGIAATILVLPLIYFLFKSPHIDSVGNAVAPWPAYFWRQGSMVPLHLSLFVWPWPLTFDRDVPAWLLSSWAILPGWALLAGILALIWRHRGKTWALGLLWALVSLAPTHSFVPLLDEQSTRLLYPMLPGLALATAALFQALQRRTPLLSLWLLVAFVLGLTWRTQGQVRLWLDPVALWRADTEQAPSRWRAWTNLAVEYGERYRWPEAAEAIARAEALNATQAEVLYNSAVIWSQRTDGLKDSDRAVRELRENLKLHPDHTRSRKLLDRLASAPRGG